MKNQLTPPSQEAKEMAQKISNEIHFIPEVGVGALPYIYEKLLPLTTALVEAQKVSADRDNLHTEMYAQKQRAEHAEGQRDQLQRDNAELVKDKERLDWLEKQDFSFYGDSSQPAPFSLALQEDGCTTDIYDKLSLRSALDEAMKGTTK